ncbi:hypothetical protein CN326_09715 [Bacillus sp. AFS018417]|nr:hypothetical protein CN326_09715 [Bacillus sp. AFS018417]
MANFKAIGKGDKQTLISINNNRFHSDLKLRIPEEDMTNKEYEVSYARNLKRNSVQNDFPSL